MKRIFFLLGIYSIFLVSCSRSGTLEFNIKPTFKSVPLVLNQAYTMGNLSVKFENLTFYFSDIKLTDKDGASVNLSDVEFVQLNSFDQEGAESGQSIIFSDLKTGSYPKINFSIGVPEDLNAMDPGDFGVADPLGRTDHYWEPWASYIFAKIEGNADTDGDGVFDLKFFYHTGSDALFRSFEVNKSIVIENDAITSFELRVDYNELLKNEDGSYFDIVTFPRNHNPDDLEAITQLVNNYIKGFTYDN